MSKPPLFFIIVVLVIVVLASQRFIHQRRERLSNDAAPVKALQVTVSSKREYPKNERRSRQRQVTPPEDDFYYEVRFQPVNGGSELKFKITAAAYHQLAVGEQGTLQTQGTRFVAFTGQ